MSKSSVSSSGEQIAERLEIPMLIVALLVIPTIIIDQSSLGQTWDAIAYWLNWFIWIAFAAETAFLLSVIENKKKWLREHPIDIAIVVLTPPFVPPALQSARVTRLLRLLRLFRAHKMFKRFFTLDGLRFAAYLTFIIVLGGGAAFTIIEKQQHLNAWDGFYWALTTVTTVGSDIYPHTTLGRILALTVLLSGTGFIALLTASFAERFISSRNDRTNTHNELLQRLDEITERLKRIEERPK